MKREMDKIVFENRAEIDEIIVALENSVHKDKDSVKELIAELDVMYMEW